MIRSQILRWVGVAALSVLATGVSPLLGADLPGEYQRVEYIQSVGGGNNGQRIDTDYVHNSKTRIVCRVALEKAKLTSQWGAIFGARNGNYKANGYSFFIRFSNATKPVFCRTGAETQGSDFALDEIVTLTCEGLSAEWVGEDSGVSGSITSTGTNDDGVNPMVIFNLNTGAKDAVKPDIAYVPMKLYSFQIYEADQLVRDFVPCYRKADGAIGLYDCALGTFFANAGSGAFLKGDDVFDLSQLNVSGSPDRFGEVTPAYGTTNGLAAGESFV